MRFLAALTVAMLLGACGGGGSSNVGLDEHELIVKGDGLFHGEATCQICHGPDLRGSGMGPPLVDQRYAPSKLPDQAIYDAVQHGMRSHNSSFGPMPALPHLDHADVEAIIAYVRSVQRENGIR